MICNNCNINKDIFSFSVRGKGHNKQCKECLNTKRRKYRKNTKNSSTKKYEKTKKGFLVRLYRNMKSRIEGVQKEKHHLYKDKELLDKNEFYNWALNSNDFHVLFNDYEKSNYDMQLAPSVDRIESSIGYILSNMEWVTTKENSLRGLKSRYNDKI